MYDRGAYNCRAENRLGTSEVSTFLTVEEQPMPVAITTPPHDASAIRGSTVQVLIKYKNISNIKINNFCFCLSSAEFLTEILFNQHISKLKAPNSVMLDLKCS
jgi:hypothetical protein